MIVAIDPGTSNTGVVMLDRRHVEKAATFSGKPVGIDNTALEFRCAEIAERLEDFIGSSQVNAFVIEGFVPFRGTRGNANTFQTPWLAGYLSGFISAIWPESPIYVQLSADVLNPNRGGNAAWVKEAVKCGNEPLPGAKLCTNDHTRSALAHGIYWLMVPDSKGVEE